MSIIGELSSGNQVAMAVAVALEQALGGEVILAVGLPQRGVPTADQLPAGTTRVVSSLLVEGAVGGVHVVVSGALANQLERIAPDEEMVTALRPVLDTAATAMSTIDGIPLEFDAPHETAPADLFATHSPESDFLVYPLLDGTERVAALVIEIGEVALDVSLEAATPSSSARAMPEHVGAHEFQPLHESGISLVDPRPLSLLHDVEMGVTAELGRRRMTVRDLLGLTPGAVIELDRAAGSPVDVLVNGTLIARGEVVVIDEEFGIRISEIVAGSEAVA